MFVDPAETAASQLEACRPPPSDCTEPGAIPNTATLDISMDILPLPEEEQERIVFQDTEIDTEDPQCTLSDSDVKDRQDTEEQSESAAGHGTTSPILSLDDSLESQEAKARVIYSFKGQADNELDIEAGEMVVLVQKESHGWWLVSNDENIMGWVPASYLQELRWLRRSRRRNGSE